MTPERITKEELEEKLSKGESLMIIDLRNPVDYAKSSVKIKGAIRMTMDALEKRCGELDPGKEVISYCT